MNKIELERYATLLAECFQDDPGIRLQFEGIEDHWELFRNHCKSQIAAFDQVDGVVTAAGGAGLALGYWTGDEARLIQALEAEAARLLASAPGDVWEVVQENAEKLSRIVRHDWYRKFWETGEVYVLQAIAVHPSVRRTGVFREMMTVILTRAERRGLPVVLQTVVQAHVAKYRHMGFQLLDTVLSGDGTLTCYNLGKS